MKKVIFKPLNKKRFPEQIADQIRFRISEDNLAVGDHLPSEIKMAEAFGVSRSVIREAMRILESLGLVRIKKGPRGGIFVADGYHKPLSTSLKGLVNTGQVLVDHIAEVRSLIFPYVTERAALTADNHDIDQMLAIIKDSQKAEDDAVLMRKNRARFCQVLTEAVGNPVMVILMKSVLELLREYFYDFEELEFERRAVKSLQSILEAIKNRESGKARKIMEELLSELNVLLRAHDQKRSLGAVS